MTELITVTYDGKVLKPTQKLSLDIGKQYQIELINNDRQKITQEHDKINFIRSHESFLNGYASEDEGLYDDY